MVTQGIMTRIQLYQELIKSTTYKSYLVQSLKAYTSVFGNRRTG